MKNIQAKINRFKDLMTSSPCVAVCKIDEDSNLCLGCFRTLDEIASWSMLTREQKLDINKKCKEREIKTQ